MRVTKCYSCREDNLARYNYCFQCGVPATAPAPAASAPGPKIPPVDKTRILARRVHVLAAMQGRAGQVRKRRVADLFDAFMRASSGGSRGWSGATPDDVFDWLCYLDTHGGGTKWVHVRSCPGLGLEHADACLADSACGKFYAADSLRTGSVSKLKMAYKELLFRGDDWNPASGSGNPCGSPRVDLYITYTAEAQQQAGVQVNQAPPLLAPTLASLLSHMRNKARLATSAQESMEIARDVALYSLLFHTMRRGFDISFTLGSQLLRLPDGAGWIVNFQFGKTLRSSKDARVVLADPGRAETCAVQGVSAYLEAALRQGWDLSLGHLFPVVEAEGQRGHEPMTAPRMKTAFQRHLRAAGLPDHFTIHSFRVGGSLSQSLAGTPVDEIMKIGGWKTRKVAEHYIGQTRSCAQGAPADVEVAYQAADAAPTGVDFQAKFAACRSGRAPNKRKA